MCKSLQFRKPESPEVQALMLTKIGSQKIRDIEQIISGGDFTKEKRFNEKWQVINKVLLNAFFS